MLQPALHNPRLTGMTDFTNNEENPKVWKTSKDIISTSEKVSTPQRQNKTPDFNSPPYTTQVLRSSSSSKSYLPSHTEIHTVSPSAAGIPVLEVVRRLESENILSKDDRLALKEALYSTDATRREEVIKALCDVELSMNSRFATRKLKSVIHQNGSGLSQPVNEKRIPPSSGAMKNNLNLHLKLDKVPGYGHTKQGHEPQQQQQQQQVQQVIDGSDGYGLGNFGSGRPSRLTPTHSNNINSSNNNTQGNKQSGDDNESSSVLRRSVPNHPTITQSTSPDMISSRKYKASPSGRGSSATRINNNNNNSSNSSGEGICSNRQEIKQLNLNQLSSRGGGSGKYHQASPEQQQQSQPQMVSNRSAAVNSGRYSGRNSGRNSGNQGNNFSPATQMQNSNNNNHSPTYYQQHQLQQQQQQQQQQWNDYDENISVQNAINQVVGDQPLYSGPSTLHSLDKISARLHEYQAAKQLSDETKNSNNININSSSGSRNHRPIKYAVVVGCGSFNPLTRMHLRTFYLAKQYIEAKLGHTVLGTLLSPAHGVTVRERFRTNTNEIIPSPHRLAVAQLLVQNSKWLGIDAWEITRRRPMDYLSLLEHVQTMLNEQFPDTEIKVFYFSKGKAIPTLSPQALRAQNFGCITVCRAPESDQLRASLTGKWNGIISVVEDTAILDASLDIVTSRKVRDKIRSYESVAQLVGEKIQDYVIIHHIGQKMNGTEDWTAEEKALPKFASRPAEVHLRSQQGSGLSVSSSVASVSSMGGIGNVSGLRGLTGTSQHDGAGGSYYTPSWSSGGGHNGTGLSSAGINGGGGPLPGSQGGLGIGVSTMYGSLSTSSLQSGNGGNVGGMGSLLHIPVHEQQHEQDGDDDTV